MARNKIRSAAALRERLRIWLAARGGVPGHLNEEVFHGKLCVHGGDVELPLQDGKLIVHLPSDDDLGFGLSINTRLVDCAPQADANQYSGKWNFSHYEDEDELFAVFTARVGAL